MNGSILLALLCTLTGYQIAVSFSEIDLQNFPASNSAGTKFTATATNGASSAQYGGDFNGDGISDIIIGAYLADVGGRTDSGAVYVVFGHGNDVPFPDTNLVTFTSGSLGVVFYGPTPYTWLGHSVSSAGDFNGDGIDDIVMAAPRADPLGRTDAGMFFLMYGHTSATRPFVDNDLTSFTTDSTGLCILGAIANDLSGFQDTSMSPAGDVNGDGFDDIFIGAFPSSVYGRAGSGSAFVIFGRRSTTTDIDLLNFVSNTVNGFRVVGIAGTNIGFAVGGDFDFNQDGYSDVIIGCSYCDPLGRNDAGAAFVLFGHKNTTAFPEIDINSWSTAAGRGFQISGAVSGNQLGSDCSAAGDINGDGVDDIMVGALYYNNNAGAVYVIFGTSTKPHTFTDIDIASFASGSLGVRIFGAASAHILHKVTHSDINGDGVGDIIVGAPHAAYGARSGAGLTYVIYGRTTGYSDIFLNTFSSGAAGFLIGGQAVNAHTACLGFGGDFNNDGTEDLIVTGIHTGLVYVIFGIGPPTSAPTIRPTALPSAPPSCMPSFAPTTASPSAEPTVTPLFKYSATYRVRNGYAFAVTTANGTVHTWGEAARGGDSSSASQHLLSGNIEYVVPAANAYAAVTRNGSLVAWGERSSTLTAPPSHVQVTALVATEGAFAGIDTETGGVVAFGDRHNGGVNVPVELATGVSVITASAGAFAAVKTDGSVCVWGNKYAGADVSREFLSALGAVKLLVAARGAFAALLQSGRVVTWGEALTGGDSSAVADKLISGVVHVAASRAAFVAFKADTSIVVWGYKDWGGDTSAVAHELAANVTLIAHTFAAMAALKADGSVTTWGKAEAGGDSTAVQHQLVDIVKIYGNSKAFAALSSAGKVVVWGKAAYGGQIPSNKVSALSSGVISIYHTNRAFAALKSDGSVVVWGQAGHGGSPGAAVEALLVSGVHTICSNDVAFSVIKTDGSVVGWGHPVSIPTAGVLFASSSLTEHAECA